jgi:uncharacterized protein YqeY
LDEKVAPLKQKIMDDLKQAMKSGEETKRSTLRMVLSAIKNAEIARQSPASDSDILSTIAKEVKQHQESIEAFKAGNRQDLAEKEEAEMAILQSYLPEQITREEIVEEARKVIKEVGAQGPKDKGKVMPKLIAELKGKADGREINDVVTELLQS